MDPNKFMALIEEQLKRVREQYYEWSALSRFYDMSPDELLENAKTWFLRTMLNTDLVDKDAFVPSVDYIEKESLSPNMSSSYGLRYPSIVWMMSLLEEEQIDWLFGVEFHKKLTDAVDKARKGSLKGFKTTVTGGDDSVQQ